MSLERKFHRQPEFAAQYHQFINDYISQGHAYLAPANFKPAFVIPHHGIFKSSGGNSKIRVVFDGSSTSSSGTSLNQCLHSGPPLQAYLPDIITLFRLYPYAFTCDLQQCFRQILIAREDHKYQTILWRDSPDKPIQLYCLATVTYGLSSSPYQALRVIKQLVIDEGAGHQLAVAALSHNIFVDDICVGAWSIEQAIKLQRDLVSLLHRGGFHLRKWSANVPELLEHIPLEDRESLAPTVFSANLSLNVLGIQWSPDIDAFLFQRDVLFSSVSTITKRSVLSVIARVFDPCGWLSPLIMSAKHLFQLLWTRNLDWDSPVDHQFQERWDKFIKSLPVLSKLIIPRAFKTISTSYQLHVFADASLKGYSCVVYLRAEDTGEVMLLSGRSKVAPLKTISIPRLELNGCLLAAKLSYHTLQLLKHHVNISGNYLWTDSTIVLSWLKIPPSTLKICVSNRVSQILNLSNISDWRLISSTDNPADVASKGVLGEKLVSYTSWWKGPPWPNLPPIVWSLGWVQTVHTAPDSVLGTYDRPAVKLFKLPLAPQDQ